MTARLLLMAQTNPNLSDNPMAATDAATAGSATNGGGLAEVVFAGGWVGMSILLLLLTLSLTVAYLIFEQIMVLRRRELMPSGLSESVRGALQAGDFRGALGKCREQPSLLSHLLMSGLAEAEGGWDDVEGGVEDALADQAARLLRKIEYLSVIANIAPMVGLLGTVTGMIFAFQRVAATQGTAGAADLAEGIYQALVTTVGGLLVAIPSLGAFAILRNRVDGLVAEAAHAAQHALLPLKRRAPRKAPPSPPKAPQAGERPA